MLQDASVRLARVSEGFTLPKLDIEKPLSGPRLRQPPVRRLQDEPLNLKVPGKFNVMSESTPTHGAVASSESAAAPGLIPSRMAFIVPRLGLEYGLHDVATRRLVDTAKIMEFNQVPFSPCRRRSALPSRTAANPEPWNILVAERAASWSTASAFLHGKSPRVLDFCWIIRRAGRDIE